MQIEQSKTQYLLGDLHGDFISSEIAETIQSFLTIENLYMAAAREITTKLENLNDEYKITSDRQPIHQIKMRIKTPSSIIDKLIRKGFEVNIQSIKEQLNDIAGVG